jgi:dTDP-glucose 4,6-dehydratase|tara:strand:+ start:162 stop:1091 length:930 start_codon:yes stop_codon:yes gene_type:complete
LNILITGGAGFVCSHLADTLFDKKHDLILLDNLLTGNKQNIEHLLDHKNVKFIKHDVQDHIDISEEIDFIFHFASAASPIAYQENPVNTLKAGSIGTINTLGLAKVKNADYLLASTSEIYGDPEISPQSEDYWGNVNPNGERSMYDEAKRFAEAATATYSRTYNLQTKIVRIFNTYGPRMQLNDGRVVTNFIVQALNGKDITIYGDGSQTRSFSYVQDTVNGIVSLMESEHNDVFNIGNPTEITINELASKIIEITNSNSKLINKDLPQDDPKQRKPDITKAKTMLNWEPKVKLEDGLTKTIEWVNSQL